MMTSLNNLLYWINKRAVKVYMFRNRLNYPNLRSIIIDLELGVGQARFIVMISLILGRATEAIDNGKHEFYYNIM